MKTVLTIATFLASFFFRNLIQTAFRETLWWLLKWLEQLIRTLKANLGAPTSEVVEEDKAEGWISSTWQGLPSGEYGPDLTGAF